MLQLRRIGVGNHSAGAAVRVAQSLLLQLGVDETFHLTENLVDVSGAEMHIDILSAVEAREIENGRDQSK